MFFCINGAREGFLNGCRPFIGVDGSFIKLATGAQILAATGRDGNNNSFPLAFDIVGQEDTPNWCWFLHQLKICLGGETGKFGPYTIMSHRQKGLQNAVNQVFPNCHQRFCLRHLYANFQNVGFSGEDLKKCMDNASYAYNQHKFNIAMNDVKNESKEDCKWLSGIPKHTWARHAFDTNCKIDLVVNNLSKEFNNYMIG
ncbi:WD repeat-containing protein 43 [Hordeum vulgare]|nr:WD repeat-containing protein 43 [Hordeum vulgare]